MANQSLGNPKVELENYISILLEGKDATITAFQCLHWIACVTGSFLELLYENCG